MRRFRASAAVLTTALMLSASIAEPASAQRAESVGINSYIPYRIDHLIGFTPSHGMYPNKAPMKPITVRFAGRTYRFVYMVNSSAVWPNTDMILRTLARDKSSTEGGFVDRRLTARQRARLSVRLDLGRDADVLAVAAGHPACGSGLTRAQASGIATGAIRRWSAVGFATGGEDAIALRLQATGSDGFEPRMGLKLAESTITKPPAGARVARDGGLGEAASGNMAVAAITSWSRARNYGTTVCTVPIGGVTASDDTVMALRYPEAYPISYVVSKRMPRASRSGRAALKGFIDWLGGPTAAEQFQRRGMLLVP